MGTLVTSSLFQESVEDQWTAPSSTSFRKRDHVVGSTTLPLMVDQPELQGVFYQRSDLEYHSIDKHE